MSKAVVEDKEAFYKWLAEQPLCKWCDQKQAGTPPIPKPAEMSEEDKAFAEAMKGMA